MPSLSVKASGMVTAVGFNAAASLAAIRAGISGVREANLWDAESGEYLSAAKIALPQWWEGLGKLAELVAPAIHECLVAAEPVPRERIPILLGVAAPNRPHRFPNLDEQILDEVEFKLELPHHPLSRVIPRGQVSGVIGIQIAQQLIESKKVPCCIVAGVDSFLQQNVVEAYMEQRRIMTPNNSNGFFPGEAGCAVLIGPASSSANGELHILGLGFAKEKATIESEEPLRGEGLTQAIGEAFSRAGCTIHDTAYRITDLNGEHYKFKEASFAANRFLRKSREVLFDVWHPIEYVGEIGAAIIPCTLAVTFHASQKEYAPGDMVLLHFSNDDGERAALVTRFVGKESNR